MSPHGVHKRLAYPLRLPPAERVRLQAAASKTGQTMNDIAIRAIIAYLDRLDQETGISDDGQ